MPRRGQVRPAEERRRHPVKTYVTDAELAQIQAAADMAGMTLAAFLRSVALGVQPRARRSGLADAAVRQLAAIGNNLNQLARHANSTGRLPDEEHLLQVLAHVMQAVRKVSGA